MEKRDNSGALFKNDRKEKETHPDFKGNLTVAGVDYWISGWTKQGKIGEYTSLAVTKKEAKAETAQPVTKPAAKPTFDDSQEIPF